MPLFQLDYAIHIFSLDAETKHLFQIKDVESITLEEALELLSYPLTLGNHPDDGRSVLLKLSKFGFSIRHRRTIAPVPKGNYAIHLSCV
ncbi:hypothetical protein HHK36_015098 [Tetracentron sinense]|uniref:Uncharacterized protein n=1 Tax=Tetracentron sinense TaxID=13715 RepID=A0A834Z6K4_TETSI|nr:hypothetical protein HHK36_015098 [Tetracentron sinense]